MRVRYFEDKAVDPPRKEPKVLKAPTGTCTICGHPSLLLYECSRCHKRACDKKPCKVNIQRVTQCKAAVK
jgi:hypothetical protein